MAWDTHARRRIDLVGRKDDGDKVIAHEFDFSVKNQVRLDGLLLQWPPAGGMTASIALCKACCSWSNGSLSPRHTDNCACFPADGPAHDSIWLQAGSESVMLIADCTGSSCHVMLVPGALTRPGELNGPVLPYPTTAGGVQPQWCEGDRHPCQPLQHLGPCGIQAGLARPLIHILRCESHQHQGCIAAPQNHLVVKCDKLAVCMLLSNDRSVTASTHQSVKGRRLSCTRGTIRRGGLPQSLCQGACYHRG